MEGKQRERVAEEGGKGSLRSAHVLPPKSQILAHALKPITTRSHTSECRFKGCDHFSAAVTAIEGVFGLDAT